MAGNIGKLHNAGRLTLQNIAFTSEYLQRPLIVKSGVFRFDNDKIWFEKFNSSYGSSDITMDGHLSNVVNYILAAKQTLKGDFTFHSNYLLADEFMTPEENPPATSPGSQANKIQPAPVATTTGVFVIPDNLDIGLKADVKKVSFMKLDINNLNTSIQVKAGVIALKSMSFDMIGCKVNMDASYGSISDKRAFFDFHIKAEDFDIKRAYNEVALFRNLSTSAGKCEGNVSLDYSLKGNLDAGMNPIYPSLEGGGVLTLKKIKVMGLKLFTSMSQNLGKEKIKSPDLSKVDLKTTIKNNVITLEKTRMKFAGFRFRVAGQSNFNGSVDLKTRLGLPPLGIVGIPIRVLGTMESPKFKYGRGTNDENVEETEYSDTIPPNLLSKIKSAKEEDTQEEPDK
jgi:AsmA protein